MNNPYRYNRFKHLLSEHNSVRIANLQQHYHQACMIDKDSCAAILNLLTMLPHDKPALALDRLHSIILARLEQLLEESSAQKQKRITQEQYEENIRSILEKADLSFIDAPELRG